MTRIVVSLWLLPAPGGARVSSRKMTAAEAALAGAIGIVPGTTSVKEVPDDVSIQPPGIDTTADRADGVDTPKPSAD